MQNLITVLSTFYEVEKWKTKVGCDNYGAIKISRRRLRRIRPSMRCVDTQTKIKKARNKMTTNPLYCHVYVHMENYL